MLSHDQGITTTLFITFLTEILIHFFLYTYNMDAPADLANTGSSVCSLRGMWLHHSEYHIVNFHQQQKLLVG